ncbi:hypothetical protein PENTCL1PPCAC_12140, partial [Pristionchus entomophagus]
MTEQSCSVPFTSREPPEQGASDVSNTNTREFSIKEDWKIFQCLKERMSTEEETCTDGVPKWLEKRISPEEWKKLNILEKWHLRQESKASGSLTAAAANDLLARKGVQRSKIKIGNLTVKGIPDLLVEEQSGALRKVDVFEGRGIAADDDDAEGPTRGLPDWVIPKNRLFRSFLQFRAELDAQAEKRLLRDSFMVFDDDPIMCAESAEDTPSKPEVFKLRPLMITEVDWDDWKREKSIPIVRRVNPSHDLLKGKTRVDDQYATYWEHKLKPSELAKLRNGGISEKNPLFYWNRSDQVRSLQGRKYYLAEDFQRTSKLAKIAIANLTKEGVLLTEESIHERMSELDETLTTMKTALKEGKRTESSNENVNLDAPSTSKTPEVPHSISVSNPNETPKGNDVLSPDSPNKRVLPARTRKPTVKEAERREEEKERAAHRRSRDKCSKEREMLQSEAPAVAAGRSISESPEKEHADLTSTTTSSTKTSPTHQGKVEEQQRSDGLKDKPKRRKGINVGSDDDEEEEEVIGKTKEGKGIVLVQRGNDGWSIRFDDAEDSNEKEPEKRDNKAIDDEDCKYSDDNEDDFPSTMELSKLHPSELIIYRDRKGEVRLAPRCCLADCRDEKWTACRRPGRNDVMSASLAKHAYEMDLNVAWRYNAVNQRLCQLHSRLLRTAGFGGNVREELIGWMGRRDCSDLEKQLVGREPTTPFLELEKRENKWLNWQKPVSPQILMESMREINREARHFAYSLRHRKRRVKRVKIVPKGMKKETRMLNLAQYVLKRINLDNLTEEAIAALSGKERRTLAELIRLNMKALVNYRKETARWWKRQERKAGKSDRPMTPISCDSVAGSAADFEKTIGPLIQCMVRRPLGDGASTIRKIKKIGTISRKTKRSMKSKTTKNNKEETTGSLKKTVRRRKNRRSMIKKLKSGELFNVTKYNEMRRKMRPIVKEMKKSTESKLHAFESLLGKKIPGLREALEKEEPPAGEYMMLTKSECTTVPLTVVTKENKGIRKEFVVVGVLRDREAKAISTRSNPLLYLAYRKGDRSRKIVKLMPAISEGKMRKGKTIEAEKMIEEIDGEEKDDNDDAVSGEKDESGETPGDGKGHETVLGEKDRAMETETEETPGEGRVDEDEPMEIDESMREERDE